MEVQGGHIVRSTGRKDRHSKVCTAKGPRDRRVRLAAHTAIQFYDVQDRLGYDRPSKAVDWLIKKAKAAIDELAELPAWHPADSSAGNSNLGEMQRKVEDNHQNQQQQMSVHHGDLVSGDMHHSGGGGDGGQNGGNSSFLPPALDSDAIADTIKSFFPIGASVDGGSSSMAFPSFPTPDLLSRNNSNSQDLRLSLQSLQDPILQQQNPNHHNEQAHVLLSGTPLGFDGWPEHHHQQAAEISRFQRLAAWNAAGGGDASVSGGAAAASGYLFNSTPTPAPAALLGHGHNQFFSQRGPLQSSNTPAIRAWMDPSAVTIAAADHGQHHHHHLHPAVVPIYPSSMPGIGFASGVGGFSGFHIPARIQGDEEERDGYSDKPSSASSDSRR